MKRILIAILPLLLCGCASSSLAGQMEQRGITHHNTSKIVLTGSEADVGPDIKVEIEEQFLVIFPDLGRTKFGAGDRLSSEKESARQAVAPCRLQPCGCGCGRLVN